MSANLPYVTSSSSIKNALDRIRNAATPPRFTGDFVEAVLQIKGGTGRTIPPFLKRIGLVAADGSPTELYRRFRNPATGGAAIAEAIKHGYKDLTQANEYFYKLNDKDLLALIVQVTGVETDNRAAAMTLSTLRVLKSYADFDAQQPSGEFVVERQNRDEDGKMPPPQYGVPPVADRQSNGRVGLNLSYTINLNLPATPDQAVFNAIFRSLKEHLLSSNE